MIPRIAQLPQGLVTVLLAATWLAPSPVCAGPTVDISMRAAFPSPPYLIELLETAAQENATSYFPILDRIAAGAFRESKTDKDLYETFLKLLQEDGHMGDSEALSTFKLALSMRSAAPRVEAHYQYYRTAVSPSLSEGQAACEAWLALDSKQFCRAQLETSNGVIENRTNSRTVPFDRVTGHGPEEVVLYADPAAANFGEYHEIAMGLVRAGTHSYRLRYVPSATTVVETLPVNGYGVELALKRTDYIVIDDRDSSSDAAVAPAPVDGAQVVLGGDEEVADLKPLSTSELSSLGMKAASYIMQTENPFETLVKLTQDFPKYSTSILSHNVSEDFETEHIGNRQQIVPAGTNVLWMNGVQLIERQIEPFGLVDLLRRERKLIHGVLDLGLTGIEAVALLGHPEVATSKADEDILRVDWTDEMEDGRVIIWLNNLEKDKRYNDYSDNLGMLLQPTMPGSLPPVRRDIFNLIVPVDFSKIEDVALVSEQLMMYVKRKFPVRFGIVPLASTPEAAGKAKVVYHLLENYGLIALAAYFDGVVAANGTKTTDQALFDVAIKDRTLRPEATALPYDEILTSEHHDQQVRQAQHWAERLQANSEVPPVFINGFPIKRDVQWMQAMSQRLGQDLRMVQEALFYGKLEADTWIPKMFLQNALKRRNPYIYPEENNELHVWDINKVYTEHRQLFAEIPIIEAAPESTLDDWATLTVIVDLSDIEGKKLLTDALIFRQANPGLRLDIIHNPVDSDRSSAVNTALNSDAVNLLDVQSLDDLEMILSRAKPRGSRTFEHFLPRFLVDAAIRPGDNMLALNGRLIGSIASASHFVQADFQQFLDSERAKRILPVYAALADLNLTDKVSGPLDAAKMTSVTALSTISDLPEGIFESAPTLRISAFSVWNSTYTAFETGDESTATIHFVAVINPATEQGQRWAPILKVLSELDGVYMKIWLNPRDQLTELPVKRFFRSVLRSSPSFDDAGKVQSLSASFKGLPSEALLTAAVDVPPAWLVSSKVSVHDLDNIKLSSIKADVKAVYELENILIEGHSREIPSARPPPGVQLVLATEEDPHFADTIVMENLGYFQFKANPGYYNLHLEEGRSSDIFRLESVGAQGMAPVPGDNGTEVILMDFMGTTLYPRMVRNPGKEGEEVLMGLADEEPSKPSDLLSKGLKFAEGILGGSKKPKKEVVKSVSDTEHAEINIFSVASGHLYERMLNIMMVSVMRHTNHTVKFWFIEQFLSPSFKDFIPTMAAEYGFKYEMVTYKWPHWLRGQKEKQREIWGYKILFLDVLFPLNLDKVIFVDADQIVRTDMYDLVQLDLHGAPYGFTPMCDSRTEMEGFRFWKQGYWATYLRDLPYHISALYVVDLRRFRALASGDRLRQTYHQLSADPASLANLDQDLPNHMQYQIPIFSLPQDWLWCETWCSDEALGTAKTIDLCNNPLTKEPKLDRARRQVPEWTVYDDEIAAVARRRREKLNGEDAAQVEGQSVLGEIPKGEDQEAHIKDEL